MNPLGADTDAADPTTDRRPTGSATGKRGRRALLAGLAGVSSLAVAGCLGGDGSDGGAADGTDAGGGTDGSDGTRGEEGAGETLASHPLGAVLDDRPHLGPDPFEAPATLVVLDDPSCPRCASYHDGTIATLEERHADAGALSVVVLPYPVVYPWGEPASHALEATADRDEDAFWGLLEHYFAAQGSFDGENVHDRTESWLADETDLDAAAVLTEVRDGTHGGRIRTTLAAAEEAGASRSTPTSFAFEEGAYVTSLSGSVSATTVETALEL